MVCAQWSNKQSFFPCLITDTFEQLSYKDRLKKLGIGQPGLVPDLVVWSPVHGRGLELGNLWDPFQSKSFYDFMILWFTETCWEDYKNKNWQWKMRVKIKQETQVVILPPKKKHWTGQEKYWRRNTSLVLLTNHECICRDRLCAKVFGHDNCPKNAPQFKKQAHTRRGASKVSKCIITA